MTTRYRRAHHWASPARLHRAGADASPILALCWSVRRFRNSCDLRRVISSNREFTIPVVLRQGPRLPRIRATHNPIIYPSSPRCSADFLRSAALTRPPRARRPPLVYSSGATKLIGLVGGPSGRRVGTSARQRAQLERCWPRERAACASSVAAGASGFAYDGL